MNSQELLQTNISNIEGEILKLISDKYSRDIIESILIQPKSAIKISVELGIELSTTYRRLHKLEKYNLLKTTFRITSDGKKSYYYQSKIQGIDVNFGRGNFKVNLAPNPI